MSELVLKAWDFAARHHGNQEYGTTVLPYLYHLVKVAERVRSKTKSESILIAAILHDVVEDTEATNMDVLREFNIEVAQTVDLLTHHRGISYQEYLDRVSLSDKAILIKVSDLQENLSNNPNSTQTKKYLEALEYLTRDTDGIYE